MRLDREYSRARLQIEAVFRVHGAPRWQSHVARPALPRPAIATPLSRARAPTRPQVHPWSLVEVSLKLPGFDESAVKLARKTGANDVERLRAWLEICLNRGTLCEQLEAVCEDPAVLSMMYVPEALLSRPEARGLVIDTLRPLASLSFCLGPPGCPGLGLSASRGSTEADSSPSPRASGSHEEEPATDEADEARGTAAGEAADTEARLRALQVRVT